jgi:hypothetical protein
MLDTELPAEQEADLEALVADGRGDMPLIELCWRGLDLPKPACRFRGDQPLTGRA